MEKIIKSIDDICEGLRRSTREANEALSRIRGSVGKVTDVENDDKKLELLLEEKKEEGRRECFELMDKLANMPYNSMKDIFDCHNMANVLQNFTLEGIENGIERWESESKVKRGDIVIVYHKIDSTFSKKGVYIDTLPDHYVVLVNGEIVVSRYDINEYWLEKV